MEVPDMAPKPALVASTDQIYCASVLESRKREAALRKENASDIVAPGAVDDAELESNYFKSAQWTPDGTSLLTSSADNTTRTFILPPELLNSPDPISLIPYTIHTQPTPISCLAPYPHYELSNPSSTLYIATPSSLPIRLLNTLSPTTTPTATYPFVSSTTEAHLTSSSLLWSSPGTHFLTGSDCLIALFDVSRPGSGPVTLFPTIPSKRHKLKGGGVGMRGIVSSLSLQPDVDVAGSGMLAAGTWTRWVGLYDMGGMGGSVGTWSIESAAREAGIGGAGVMQTGWSGDGRYLYVAERKSNGVLVYDVRVTGKMVGWLEGRGAETNQRLGVDFFEGEMGTECWAGGMDGKVRVWEGLGLKEGGCESNWEWEAHKDTVSSTVVHSSGTVVATCSGQRAAPMLDYDSDSDDSQESERVIFDNSLKVWRL